MQTTPVAADVARVRHLGDRDRHLALRTRAPSEVKAGTETQRAVLVGAEGAVVWVDLEQTAVEGEDRRRQPTPIS